MQHSPRRGVSPAGRQPTARPQRILVINPGSTSTRLSVFEGGRERVQATLVHPAAELKKFARVMDQTDFRMGLIRSFLNAHGVEPRRLSAVVGRGGLLKPIPSGVYRVNPAMLADLRACRYGEHASNLGALLASRLAREAGCRAFIVDPVVVDEMEAAARITGLPELKRKSIFHALNQKAAAKAVARQIGRAYARCNFIVAHLGGGISVGAHRRGRVVDVNNALDGDGPFAPERAGGLPTGQLVDLCYSGKYTLAEMKQKLAGRGGLVAYRGSNSVRDLKRAMRAGDAQARLLYAALVRQVSQEIARHGATFRGHIDRIILTGGLAGDPDFVARIRERVGYLAPVAVVPGEREMAALAQAVLAVLRAAAPEREYRR